jgi:hypothetical protein
MRLALLVRFIHHHLHHHHHQLAKLHFDLIRVIKANQLLINNTQQQRQQRQQQQQEELGFHQHHQQHHYRHHQTMIYKMVVQQQHVRITIMVMRHYQFDNSCRRCSGGVGAVHVGDGVITQHQQPHIDTNGSILTISYLLTCLPKDKSCPSQCLMYDALCCMASS